MASSAAAFVEGGIQDACEDTCSICLECFSDADPAVVTCCKHEYHLQCIIEWSQRSKECPMCWQALSLKDPDSQELLAAVEQERAIRNSRINVSGVFPPEGYELHRLSYGDDSDFEERMMRHLAFITMGRRPMGRRDGGPAGIRTPYGEVPSQFVILPAQGNSPGSAVPVPAGSLTLTPAAGTPQGSPSTPESGSSSVSDSSSSRLVHIVCSILRGAHNTQKCRSRGSPRLSSEGSRRSPTEMHSFSESLKSRLAAASSRYKESLTKTTKSFRDKLRMRNGSTMADIGARAREVSAGVVRALERISLESPEESSSTTSGPHDNGNEHSSSNNGLNTNSGVASAAEEAPSRGAVHTSTATTPGKTVATAEDRLVKVPACASS